MAAGDKPVTWPQITIASTLGASLVAVVLYVASIKGDVAINKHDIDDLKATQKEMQKRQDTQADAIAGMKSDIRMVAEWVQEQKRIKGERP